MDQIEVSDQLQFSLVKYCLTIEHIGIIVKGEVGTL